MKKIKPIVRLTPLVLLISFLTLSGCGGGGGGVTEEPGIQFHGNTNPAAIDATNAQEVGEAAGESIEQGAVSGEDLPFGISVSNDVDMERLNQIALAVVKRASLPQGFKEDMSDVFCSFGSAELQSDNDPEQQSGPVDFTITFSNCVDGDITMNGRLVVHYEDISDEYSDFTARFINFRVTGTSSKAVTLNLTLVCESGSSCTANSDFVGRDGVTHRVSNFNISGNADTGYNGTLTFYHGRHGRVSVTAAAVTFGGCAGAPDGGSVSFTSTNGSSGTINFESDCGVTGTWSNPGAGTSGSF